MTRPTRLKVLYGIAVLILGGAALAVLYASDYSPTAIVVLVLLFLIPGRVNGQLWREFYTGRRLMDSGNNEDAINEFEKFLLRVREQPSLKHLIWFVWGFYTRDVEAMAHNNIGAALIREGDLGQAEQRLAQALQLDSKYPIPHYNMALIGELRGDRDAAIEALSTARSLGYRQTRIDEIANKAAEILAKIEGRRKKPQTDS